MEVEKIKKSFGNFPFIGSINLDFLVFLFIFLISGIQLNAQSSSCINFNGACPISEAASQACQLCDFFGENRECAGFELPVELFELPNTEDHGEIPAAIVQAIQDFPEDYAHLEGVERIYIGQRLHSLALEYPEATGKDLIRAAVVEFRSWIISQVSIARVNRFGNGSGGYEYSVQLTASRMPGSYIVGDVISKWQV